MKHLELLFGTIFFIALLLLSCEKKELLNQNIDSDEIAVEMRDEPPTSIRWLDWSGDLDKDCFVGPDRECIEVVFASDKYAPLLDAIDNNTVANYLASDEGRQAFPFPENYINGLLNGNMNYYYFSPSTSSSTYFALH